MDEAEKEAILAKFNPYFTAIGKVANAYSQLEFSVNDAIWELANVDRSVGVCVTSQMIGPGPKNRCLLALLNFRKAPPPLIKEFNVISVSIEKVAARRNRYVHDPMTFNPETDEVQRMEASADRQIKYGFMSGELQDLAKLAADIENISDAFDVLYLRAVAELPPWPRTQFSQSTGIVVHRTG